METMSNADQSATGMQRGGNMSQSYEGDDMARHNNNKRKGVSFSSNPTFVTLFVQAKNTH